MFGKKKEPQLTRAQYFAMCKAESEKNDREWRKATAKRAVDIRTPFKRGN